jgi:hypothetical protein
MAYNESGHAVNVANFKELIAFTESIGGAYNPPVDDLEIEVLKKKADELDEVMKAVNDAQANHRKSTNDRVLAYESINTLSSRVIATLSVLGVETKTIKDARAIIGKITGTSKKKVIANTDVKALPAKTVSTSQMSFEQRKNNFERLISLVQAEPLYKSNEPDLTIDALGTYSKQMSETTNKVLETENALKIARQNRDNALYEDKVGAVDIGLRVKEFVKSKYAAKSAEYKRIKSIALSKKRTV